MATTAASVKEPLAWLVLGLTYQRQGEQLELLITFKNTHSEAHQLSFSNQTRKAELLGLQIKRPDGERVLPTHHLLIKPTNSETASRLLEQGEVFSYSLTGMLMEQGLIFPGAIFPVVQGETYQIYFQYAGQQTNTITLTI